MCPISTRLVQRDGAAARRTQVARGDLPQIEIFGLEIFAGRDVAQMIIVLVRAGDHVAAALQSLVRDDRACS